ncbi:hypothetical protein Hanom_Chr11g00996541 [Helianthus anomalus]
MDKIQASRNQHGYDQNLLKPIHAVLKPQETENMVRFWTDDMVTNENKMKKYK